MEKAIVLDDWLRFDEIRDLDYGVVHEQNEYHGDDGDGDKESIVEHLSSSTLLLLPEEAVVPEE
jgi:hypothetical protein